MGNQSSKFILLLGVVVCLLQIFIDPVLAKKDPAEKRENAIVRLVDLESRKKSSTFNRYLKKTINLYSRHIKKLQEKTSDEESALLLEEVEKFHTLIQTGAISQDAVIEKLKHEHELMKLVEYKLKQKALQQQPLEPTQVVTMSIGGTQGTMGSTDYAPARKIKRDPDEYDISISIPMDVGKRHGFDKLREEE
ncbi:MAG: hypothetical protein K0M45_03515 [Candidatus Paracaedibacteraceae bacterium]|nr:hypothetical protein [Candidatus Paracaedibacteraceae bacterium]